MTHQRRNWSSQVPLILQEVSKFSLRRTYELFYTHNFHHLRFLISLKYFFILLIISGYENDKLRDCALFYLRRHPYVSLPIIVIIVTITTVRGWTLREVFVFVQGRK